MPCTVRFFSTKYNFILAFFVLFYYNKEELLQDCFFPVSYAPCQAAGVFLCVFFAYLR